MSTLEKTDEKIYEPITDRPDYPEDFEKYHGGLLEALRTADRQVYELVLREYQRQQSTLQLLAAENQCSQAVLAALGSVVQNKTVEGFAGARFHGGSGVVDDIERLAIARAKAAFGAKYANVQPHSGSQANQIVLTAILQSGDKILSLALDQGGHWSHGARLTFADKFFDVSNYFLDRKTFLLDYDAIADKAARLKPKLIMCGASAYAGKIDFKKFREIADRVGAYLLADISHISGLVIAGAHPSPVDYAHFTTTSTYKAGGPRGGLTLMGKDYDRKVGIAGKSVPLWKFIENTTFPGLQGTPYLNNIAAKAVFFKETLCDEYKTKQFKIVANAKALAKNLHNSGLNVLTGGTDNHMLLVNVCDFKEGLTGHIAQKSLEDCDIVVDIFRLPYDKQESAIAGGIRLGTPVVTKRRMAGPQMDIISELITAVLKNVTILTSSNYSINESVKADVKARVAQLCTSFPMGKYLF